MLPRLLVRVVRSWESLSSLEFFCFCSERSERLDSCIHPVSPLRGLSPSDPHSSLDPGSRLPRPPDQRRVLVSGGGFFSVLSSCSCGCSSLLLSRRAQGR